MESKEEVHIDDGSYELIDFEDCMERLTMKADASSNMDLSSEDSYDFLSSDLSEEEDSNIKTANEEDSTKSDFNSDEEDDDNEDDEEDDEFEEEEEEDDDLSSLEVSDSDDKDKKMRYFIAKAYQMYKAEIKIKELAKDNILQYLPAKSLAKCKLVSKEWNSWISTPFFAHTQSQHFSQTSGFFQNKKKFTRFVSLNKSSYGVPCPILKFLPQKVFTKSSSNGLLLCHAFDDESKYYICNPSNKEWIELPNSSYYHGKDPKIVLAFKPSSLTFDPYYQIICPFSRPKKGSTLYFDIYDSNTKSWGVSEEKCMDFDASTLKSDGVFVNGVVYWETTGGKLLAFDLKDEIHSVRKLPISGGALSKVNGELCYVKGEYLLLDKMCMLDVYRGGRMSLKKTMRFGVPFDGVADGGVVVECSVLGNSSDDDIVVALKKSKGRHRLFVYNVKNRRVEGPAFLWSIDKLFPYVNSLVSIAH